MLLIALALLADVDTVVRVEGRSYRVETHGEAVKVSQKAMFTKTSTKTRARMRKAVRLATGCSIIDDYWEVTALEGELSCVSSPAPSTL